MKKTLFLIFFLHLNYAYGENRFENYLFGYSLGELFTPQTAKEQGFSKKIDEIQNADKDLTELYENLYKKTTKMEGKEVTGSIWVNNKNIIASVGVDYPDLTEKQCNALLMRHAGLFSEYEDKYMEFKKVNHMAVFSWTDGQKTFHAECWTPGDGWYHYSIWVKDKRIRPNI